MPLIKTIYLTNKDILREIHRSKNTFCSFVDKSFHQYDIIVTSVKKINARTIAQAKKNKAARLAKELHESAMIAENKKLPSKSFEINYKTIPKQDLIFRVMTFDHIPTDGERKKTKKTVADHYEKINFPPFQHFKFDENNDLKCIGKSHWKGDLVNGVFCKTHGKMTEELGRMFLKLCDRYATRSNVRSYTYNDEMKGQAILQLSQIGLQFDESKSNNPFAYYTAAVTNSFVRVINIEKRNQNIRDDILEMNDLNPSWTRQNENSWNDFKHNSTSE